jgi:hypothetical protein
MSALDKSSTLLYFQDVGFWRQVAGASMKTGTEITRHGHGGLTGQFKGAVYVTSADLGIRNSTFVLPAHFVRRLR